MKRPIRLYLTPTSLILAAIVVLGGLFLCVALASKVHAQHQTGTLVTIYDRGTEKVLLAEGETIGDALKEADITVEKNDAVEPAISEKMVASEYRINIYRARPVIVVDGAKRQKIMTAYQTPAQIVGDVDISLYPEDEAVMSRSDDLLSQGAGLQLTIDRATAFTFTLHGSTSEARTQAKTVGDMLEEKGIKLSAADRVSPGVETPMTEGMEVRFWREGRQTVTVEEAVAFPVEQIRDADRPVGYQQIQTPGREGKRKVTYEIEVRDGAIVSRAEIASLVITAPVKQVEIIGAKTSGRPLTKSMGVNQFTDSNGVVHRETYYDLNMSRVMTNCGAGGYYTVRPADGVKVDREGYVIIAANLANYPRCSVVETSVGLGKVYDTGGFAARHPHGWDIATDWTKADGI